jgi:type VI secretion system protein ImpA
MSSPATIDIEALLQPIAGENPAGENLQYSGLHDEIREARRAEDNLSQGDWQRDVKSADWDRVVEISSDALSKRTKDLQVAAWFTEAMIQLRGFSGLRDGLKLARGLHERFWEKLYPEVEDGDLEARANSISWLDRQSASAIQAVPVTKASRARVLDDADGGCQAAGPPGQCHVDESRGGSRSERRARTRAASEGRVTTESFAKARNSTRRAFYEEAATLLSECRRSAGARPRDGREVRAGYSGWESFRSLSTRFRDGSTRRSRRSESRSRTRVGGGAGEEGAAEAGGAPGVSSGPVKSRQEALRRLAEVADYFRRTELTAPFRIWSSAPSPGGTCRSMRGSET